MQRLACLATLCVTLAPWAVAQTAQEAPPPQTSQASDDGVVTKTGKTVAKGAKKGGEVTVDATKEAGSLGKKGVIKTGEVAVDVADVTVDTSKEAGNLGKETGKVVAKGSKKTGETVADGAKKTGSAVKEGFKKVF